MSEPTTRAGLSARALAFLCAAPILADCLGPGRDSAWLTLLVFLLPTALGWGSSARVWVVGVLGTFVVPLLPHFAATLPISCERTILLGALANLAWRGELARAARGGRALGVVRWALAMWLAWSVGCALRGVWVNVPPDAPWVGHMLTNQLTGWLREAPMIEASQPSMRLLGRVMLIALAWVGLEMGLRGRELERELGRALACTLLLGLLVAGLELYCASAWRGEDFLARMRLGVPRNHRPLDDHNALGAALCLLLPAQALLVARARKQGARMLALQLLGLAAGGLLLHSTKSKSAFAAVASVVVLAPTFWLAARHRAVAVLVAAGGALLVVVAGLALIAPARFDAAARSAGPLGPVYAKLMQSGPAQYLEYNRMPVWRAGRAMWASAPIAGVGLGNFPSRLKFFRDPDATTVFNPYHENAHAQGLQWAAEEGLVGLALGGALFLLALAGFLRTGQRAPWSSAVLAATAIGFFVNQLAGHALLVTSVAALYACLLALGCARLAQDAPERKIAPPRLALGLCAGLALLACAPALGQSWPALTDWSVGCHAWQMDPATGRPMSRVLTHDARWIQRWGRGNRMRMLLKVVRPGGWDEVVTRVSVCVDGEWVIVDQELPRAATIDADNEQALLKIDAPVGVELGDLVELRVLTDPPYSMTMIWDPARADQSVLMRPLSFVYVGS